MPRFIAAFAIIWLAMIAPAAAQREALPTTDILLVLAVDTSGSVNHTRFELQRRGYADAFRSQQVLNAIRGGSTGSIVVTMVQWTGPTKPLQVVRGTLIKDAGSALAFADAVEAAPRQLFGGGTSLSGAIDHAMLLLPSAPYRGLKRVIDVSGDGSNNRGRDVREARDEAVRAGVIINGLPIVSLEYDLDKYYFNNVIGGPGAFIVPADSYDNFAQAVLRKLVLEIALNDRGVILSPPVRPAGQALTEAPAHVLAVLVGLQPDRMDAMRGEFLVPVLGVAGDADRA